MNKFIKASFAINIVAAYPYFTRAMGHFNGLTSGKYPFQVFLTIFWPLG
jgi:hypothetical protein